MPTIAKRIKKIREARKISPAEFAKKIGVSTVAVWQYENQEVWDENVRQLALLSECDCVFIPTEHCWRCGMITEHDVDVSRTDHMSVRRAMCRECGELRRTVFDDGGCFFI